MQLLPYEELTISSLTDRNTYILQVPWLQLEFKLSPACGYDPQAVFTRINTRQTDFDFDVHKFLLSMKRYRLWYALPRPVQKRRSFAPPNQRSWHVRSALEFAKTDHDSFDPLTLLTICRRYVLLHFARSSAHRLLYSRLQALDGSSPEFAHLAALSLRQNHYITSRCIEIMSHALARAEGSTDALTKYIDSERGHDVILANAIESLGFEAEQLEVKSECIALMEVFEVAARTNFPAFVNMIDMFEYGSGQETHPLAMALSQRGFAKASQQIQIHRMINVSGQHEEVALELLTAYNHVDQKTFEDAMKLTETAAILCAEIAP